ncbi:MAG TPA: flagellar basal body P-ring protein FlgI [Armatimonadota bacterium]|nr:flagellar basal body P-ring protein FlgI [Armatimonadota bacterium]
MLNKSSILCALGIVGQLVICQLALGAVTTPQASTAAKPVPAPTAPVTVGKPSLQPVEVSSTSTGVKTRIKDIARIQGARDNQLMGYGLVIGLNGTGDSSSTGFTIDSVANMLQRFGVNVPPTKSKVKNVAAVMVTADIKAFVKNGDQIDVTISSLGDAKSLQGGTLLQTPLFGADNQVYAVAQGALLLGGYAAGAGGSSATSGHPTVGRIPGGALVEAEIPMNIAPQDTVTLSLLNPDFTTASRMAAAINEKLGNIAVARDAVAVDVKIPADFTARVVDFIGKIGAIDMVPDMAAKVVINEKTGTVVVGGNVTVAPVALAQGNLTVSVSTSLQVSQPEPLSNGKTVQGKTSDVNVAEPEVRVMEMSGSNVGELVRTLNAMKVSARDIIAILQALKESGALQAELVIL